MKQKKETDLLRGVNASLSIDPNHRGNVTAVDPGVKSVVDTAQWCLPRGVASSLYTLPGPGESESEGRAAALPLLLAEGMPDTACSAYGEPGA